MEPALLHNTTTFPPLDNLNPAQREAVERTEGPLLVLAGAGTGKTRVLTTRIAYILAQGLAFPSQILAVTFTNKAAREMQERVLEMTGSSGAGVWLGTFHSMCLRMLRRHAALLGMPQDFTVIDDDDRIRLLKQLIADRNLDDKRHPAKLVNAIIDRWKDKGLTPEAVTENGKGGGIELQLYEEYQQRLRTMGVMDFGDLLLHSLTVFRKHPDVLADYQRRFKYILVDEYQDTNVAQYQWLRMLAAGSFNICCVGDDDQSIYGWRGAEIENILRFEKDFGAAQHAPHIIRLECNYRSTPHILATASGVIAHNKDRLGKTLYSPSTQQDDAYKVQVVSLANDRAEAEYIVQEIESSQQRRILKSLNEAAILVRAGFQTRVFEEAFTTAGIAYRIIGGLKFYDRLEIRDAIAYVRATLQPSNDLALLRIINTPKRGVGQTSLEALQQEARALGISLHALIEKKLADNSLPTRISNKLKPFFDQLARWREMFSSTHFVTVVELILQESGYLDMWKQEKGIDAQGRLENLKELRNAMQGYETVQDYLEHVSLVTDMDQAQNSELVSIMTMHAAKGLEFDSVFLSGWEEGLFPSQRSLDESGQTGLEEERRLAYVGITRARKRLTISFAQQRLTYGQIQYAIPSRFIEELPKAHYEMHMVHGYSAPSAMRNNGFQHYNAAPFRKQSTAAIATSASPANKHGFVEGERIFHQKFGYGRITHISGDHVEVNFEKSSAKTLLAEYIKKISG